MERTYIVPLRSGFREAARHKKTKKAVSTLKLFLSQHMKQPDHNKIYIGINLNKELWKHGIKNPPSKVKITVIKEDNGDVKAELHGFKYDHKKKEEIKDKEEKPKKSSGIEEAVKKETHDHKHEHAAEETPESKETKKAAKPKKEDADKPKKTSEAAPKKTVSKKAKEN